MIFHKLFLKCNSLKTNTYYLTVSVTQESRYNLAESL